MPRGVKRQHYKSKQKGPPFKKRKASLNPRNQFGDQLGGNLVNTWPQRKTTAHYSYTTSPRRGSCTYPTAGNLTSVSDIQWSLDDLPGVGDVVQAYQRYKFLKCSILIYNITSSKGPQEQHSGHMLYLANWKEGKSVSVPNFISMLKGCQMKQIDADTVQLRGGIWPVYQGVVVEAGTATAGALAQNGYCSTYDPRVRWGNFVVQFGNAGPEAGEVISYDYVIECQIMLDRPNFSGQNPPAITNRISDEAKLRCAKGKTELAIKKCVTDSKEQKDLKIALETINALIEWGGSYDPTLFPKVF